MNQTSMIEQITENTLPHYEPYGWHHWPEHPWMSYQFRRALGETQAGGGAVSECFQAANRMIPGDKESWHIEWHRVASRNHQRGDEAEQTGHMQTAKNCWLRAANYYRHAEFWLAADDPRRLQTFDQIETCSQKFLRYLTPPGEVVQVPYENGAHLDAYFVPAPYDIGKQPVLIAMGGLDSFKDEMWFMTAHGALQRGIAVLMIDGPGQGGTLRRQGLHNRPDTEVPIGHCIDYLQTRSDVDSARIAVSGSSLGGYYAARAGCYEHRLAAVISHGAIWSIGDFWHHIDESHGLASHIKWVFGVGSIAAAKDRFTAFTLEGHLAQMQCPYLIVHGGFDVLSVDQAHKVYEDAKTHAVSVTLKLLSEEETGAEHCQHDNPTIGQEYMADWLVDVFAIDERALRRRTLRPMG